MSSTFRAAESATQAVNVGRDNRIPLASGLPLLGSSWPLLANPLRFPWSIPAPYALL